MKPAPDREHRPPHERLARRIARVLRHASVPRPVWHLTARERWRLLRDTLFGHAPIRGGLRPRDLPFDAYCRSAIATAARIHALPAYRVRAADPGEIRFIDWLVVYSALVEARAGGDAAARDAVHDCVCELRKALCFDVPAVPVQECPFVHRMMGLLGLSQQEWQRSATRPGTPDHWMNRDDARLAVVVAAAARPGSPPPRWSGNERAGLERVGAASFRLLTLRATGVQGYLERGKRHWLMRGGSAWCSQALALVRDLLLEDEGDDAATNVILLSDSDAIFSVLVPAAFAAEQVAVRLEGRLRRFWSGGGDGATGCDRRFPRLAEWRAIAEMSGVDPAGVMPAVGVRSSRPLTAVELCTGRFSRLESAEAPVIALRGPVPPLPPCDFVATDPRITTRSPAWLQEKGDRADKSLGWTGIVWTLCGTTFRTHCHEGLAASLGASHLRLVPVNHGDWLESMAIADEPLVYCKIDGDSIGARFRSTRIPRLPGLGLALADTVFRRLLSAASAVTGPTNAGGRSACLPLDIVYLGGDDLLCCIPARVLPTVLEAFGRPLPRDRAWRGVSFTFAAIELPGRREAARDGGRGMITAMAAAATRAVGAALDYAKSVTKGKAASLAADESRLRELLAEAGAEIHALGPLQTFGCVRGVRIGIRPRAVAAGDGGDDA